MTFFLVGGGGGLCVKWTASSTLILNTIYIILLAYYSISPHFPAHLFFIIKSCFSELLFNQNKT